MLPHFKLDVVIPDGAPFSALTAQWDGKKIHSVHYIPKCSPDEKEVGDRPESEVIDELEHLLNAYFSSTPEELESKPVRFDTLSSHLKEASSEFQDAVRKVVIEIPCGYVRAYSEVAVDTGRSRNAGLAVGTACGNNLLGIVIPVFRVIACQSDIYYLGDFHNGQAHTDKKVKDEMMKTCRKIKRWFLEHEGCTVDGDDYYSRAVAGACDNGRWTGQARNFPRAIAGAAGRGV